MTSTELGMATGFAPVKTRTVVDLGGRRQRRYTTRAVDEIDANHVVLVNGLGFETALLEAARRNGLLSR
jgi:hypothetical protein